MINEIVKKKHTGFIYNITGAPRQRNMAQMKEQSKTPEKELSNKEMDNLSAAEFNTLVIRMLTELIELSHKMKATQSEIKQNIQGTNSKGKETGTQINNLERKEEKTSNWTTMRKQEF